MSEFHIKADGSWEFNGEDSRLRDRTRNQVTYRIWNPIAREFQWQTMDKVYCFDCGTDGGWSARHSAAVFYLCPKCAEKPNHKADFIPMNPIEEYCWRNGLPPPKD